MSTVDPDQRWWRSAPVLRGVAVALWVVVFVAAFVTGWSNALYLAGSEWTHWAGASWLTGTEGVPEAVARTAEASMIVIMWPVLIAGFVDGYARHRGGGGEAWALVPAFGWTLLGLGTGSFLATLSGPVSWALPATLTAAGILTLLIKPVSIRLRSRHAGLQAWARSQGALAIATVTKVEIETVNDVPRWKVTLKYDDQHGQSRWHRATLPTGEQVNPRLGDSYEVRYDPARPGRRSSIHVDLQRPVNARRR
jgi:hypothetical protein